MEDGGGVDAGERWVAVWLDREREKLGPDAGLPVGVPAEVVDEVGECYGDSFLGGVQVVEEFGGDEVVAEWEAVCVFDFGQAP